MNLKGKVALVTGANAGMGLCVVKHLLLCQAKVYLGYRSQEKADAAFDELRIGGFLDKGGSVHSFQVDLASLRDVKRAVDAFLEHEEGLDILVNNAATLAQHTREVTEEGLPAPFAVTYFGTFFLTTLLLPLLKKTASEPSADVRIIFVTSESWRYAPKVESIGHLKDLDVFQEPGMINAMKRYGLAKQCCIWFAQSLQRQFDSEDTPILILSNNPGAVASPGAQERLTSTYGGPLATLVWFILKLTFKSPEVGAYGTNFCATSARVNRDREKYKNVYIMSNDRITPLTGEQVNSRELADQLWTLTERIVKDVLKDGKYEEEQ